MLRTFAEIRFKLIFVNSKDQKIIFERAREYAGEECLYEIEKYKRSLKISELM